MPSNNNDFSYKFHGANNQVSQRKSQVIQLPGQGGWLALFSLLVFLMPCLPKSPTHRPTAVNLARVQVADRDVSVCLFTGQSLLRQRLRFRREQPELVPLLQHVSRRHPRLSCYLPLLPKSCVDLKPLRSPRGLILPRLQLPLPRPD